MHAAEISRESIRLGSSIRGAREEMRERERLGRLGSVKPGRKREGGERRLSLLLSLCVCSRSFIVRSCHTIRPGRREEGGWFEHVGSLLRSLAEVERVLCMPWRRREGAKERAKEGAKRGEKADLLDLLAQYDTTGPPGGKRASERASGRGTSRRVCSPTEPAPCIISKRIQNMIRGGKKK